jgi:hypothetical protein
MITSRKARSREWRDCEATWQAAFGSRRSPRAPTPAIPGCSMPGVHGIRIIPTVSFKLELLHKPGRANTTRRAGKRL